MGTISNAVAEKNSTAVAQKEAVKKMDGFLKAMLPEIEKALPGVMTPERFTRIVTTAMNNTPALAVCTPKSFIGAVMQSAQLGLEVNTQLGEAYLIPYSNHGTMEVQFQLGYRGLIALAYRSGEVNSIQAHIVYENDTFEVSYGIDPKLNHIPAMKNRGEAIAVYAVFNTKDGGFGFEVMSMDDVKNHAEKYSKAFKSSYSPWATNFEEMAKKTVLKKVLKYAPLKSDFARNIGTDGTIKYDISKDMTEEADMTIIDGTYAEVPESVENAEQ